MSPRRRGGWARRSATALAALLCALALLAAAAPARAARAGGRTWRGRNGSSEGSSEGGRVARAGAMLRDVRGALRRMQQEASGGDEGRFAPADLYDCYANGACVACTNEEMRAQKTCRATGHRQAMHCRVRGGGSATNDDAPWLERLPESVETHQACSPFSRRASWVEVVVFESLCFVVLVVAFPVIIFKRRRRG